MHIYSLRIPEVRSLSFTSQNQGAGRATLVEALEDLFLWCSHFLKLYFLHSLAHGLCSPSKPASWHLASVLTLPLFLLLCLHLIKTLGPPRQPRITYLSILNITDLFYHFRATFSVSRNSDQNIFWGPLFNLPHFFLLIFTIKPSDRPSYLYSTDAL